jgi:Mrp family chromosome partitioning ATPase
LEKKKAQVEDIEKEVVAQADSLAHGLRSELAGTEAQETNLETELDQRLVEIQQCSHEREEWVQSFGDVSLMKKMIADTANDARQGGSVIVVVSRAVPPERPKSPKLWLNLLAGVFVCSLAGLLVSVTRTLLDDRLHSPQSVATLTNLPCVATTRPHGIFSRKIRNAPPQSPGYNPLRSQLLLDGAADPVQIIGFTPARKKDNSSRTVADLALMLTRAGRRVLVVDLNFSKPRQFELLGMKPQPSLADWMVSDEPLEEYVWLSDAHENSSLALLSWSPKLPPPTPDLLLRRPLAKILPRFGDMWDYIFIDAPAISTSWELMLSLPPGNPVVITADRRRTRASQVSDTASIAQNQSWNVAGVALQGC